MALGDEAGKGGIPADEATGQPELLAARHPACGYAWAIPAGLQIRAEALLLQAARDVISVRWASPTNKRTLDPIDLNAMGNAHPTIAATIEEAHKLLYEALDLWQPLHDPEPERPDQNFEYNGKPHNYKAAETFRILKELNAGQLTSYPLTPTTSPSEVSEAEATAEGESDNESTERRNNMSPERGKLRAMIAERLSEDEFNDLCSDHFPEVARNFAAGQSRAARVRALIEYAENHSKLVALKVTLIAINSDAYFEYFPEERPAGHTDSVAEPALTTDDDTVICDVLIINTNPQSMPALELAEEVAVIRQRLAANKGRQVNVVTKTAARPEDLSGMLLAHDPIVVHFAGHGTEDGNLVFADDTGNRQVVDAEAVGELFETVGGRVECVALNSCWSAKSADSLMNRGVPCVVGMTSQIDDRSARAFAGGFYEALAHGRDYTTAVRLGRNSIGVQGLPGQDTPMFFTKNPRMHDPDSAVSALSLGVMRSAGGWPFVVTESPPIVDEATGLAAVPRVKLWYGTNHKLLNTANPQLGYGTERDRKLNYGTCLVRVPKDHRPKGSLASSFWWRLWTGIDDTATLETDSISPLSDTRFWEQARQEISQAPEAERDVLVFVHGYRVTFEEAAVRAAQISADINFPGLTAFFSWPSQGTLIGYTADETTIEVTEPYLTDFLIQILEQSRARRIHLIAHSMGNRGVLQVMEKVIQQVRGEHPAAFGQMFLAAPDVDVDVFRNHCGVYQDAASQTTLYASPRDWAVWLSTFIHHGDRVGYHPPINVFSGIDTVRVDKVDMDVIGHGYVGAAKDVMFDMDKAIRFEATPKTRGLEERATDDGRQFWEILG